MCTRPSRPRNQRDVHAHTDQTVPITSAGDHSQCCKHEPSYHAMALITSEAALPSRAPPPPPARPPPEPPNQLVRPPKNKCVASCQSTFQLRRARGRRGRLRARPPGAGHPTLPPHGPTSQNHGPNHLGSRDNALYGHQMALITSGCAPCPVRPGRRADPAERGGRGGRRQPLRAGAAPKRLRHQRDAAALSVPPASHLFGAASPRRGEPRDDLQLLHSLWRATYSCTHGGLQLRG